MEKIWTFIIYLGAGFIEMLLITQRTVYISKNRRKAAAAVVFIENIITFFVILQLAKDVTGNLANFGAYCIGSCTGTALDLDEFVKRLMERHFAS